MSIRRIITLLLFSSFSLLFSNCSSSGAPAAAKSEAAAIAPSTTELPAMEQAATAFLQSLNEEQKTKAVFPFEGEERKNWHFVPKVRGGFSMLEMSEDQKGLAMKLLQTGLSEQGQNKAKSIMQLERVLQELEKRPYENDYRNPQLYYVAIFGTPGGEAPWGWRFEGHHLSLNFSSIDRGISTTPAFMGTNPAIVRSGAKKGTEVLKVEQDLGRELVKMLSTEQAAEAILSGPAPKDIVSFVKQKVELDEYSGLTVAKMDEAQQAKLEALLSVYLNNMKAEIAQDQWSKIKESGFENLYFAWMGDTTPGEPHYYRIHGPTILIEYDNVQNDANHIHTVWRDLTNDFGEDLLRQHYADGHKH